ncbi:hypothetical protein ACW9UR_17920 [Halovulum sp. GXIMD14794]
MAQAEILHESETLLVRHMPGSESTLVIAVGGIHGGLGGVQVDEFAGTASGGGRNHVLFVRDKLRSWFSREDVLPPLVELVQNFIAANGITKVVTIGNSMGGYGALLLPKHVPVDVAIAFAPQVSMHDEVITEPRWRNTREHFGPLLERNLAECLQDRTQYYYYVVFGRADIRDRKHIRLMDQRENLRLYKVPGSQHSVAKDLKDAGVLRDLVGHFFARNTRGANGLMRSFYDAMLTQGAGS